jgi:hypothetical protein
MNGVRVSGEVTFFSLIFGFYQWIDEGPWPEDDYVRGTGDEGLTMTAHLVSPLRQHDHLHAVNRCKSSQESHTNYALLVSAYSSPCQLWYAWIKVSPKA